MEYSADNLGDRQSQQLLGQAITTAAASSTLVAIPVFNEVAYVDEVVRRVISYAENVLVIDDGSSDGTTAVLSRYTNIRVISRPQNLGYGRSLIDVFNFAAENDFDWLITIDADHQHEPACIPRFCAEIRKGQADIISGSRYLIEAGRSAISPPPDRVEINRQITGMLNSSLGLRLTDAFCGFKAYRVEAVSRLCLTEQGYGLPLQLWVQAAAAGLRIREIPVPIIYHDPNRNFAGKLEDPAYRLNYYLDILEREFKPNGFEKP